MIRWTRVTLPALALFVAVTAWLAAARTAATVCPDSPSADGITAICGITAPEDLALFGGRYLLVTSLVPAQQLFFVDSADDSTGPLETTLDAPADGVRWGDPACPPPEVMESHGLDLSRDVDGRWRLLVVSHGVRESVEFFEVRPEAAGPPSLLWRGCVMTPEQSQFNDVVALPDGGYLATDPTGSSWQRTRAVLGMLGFNTGRVYRWRPGNGHEAVPNTDAYYPNGIVLDPDGRAFYVNAYFDDEVRRHDLASGELLGRVHVDKPDNSNWSPDGELLVASHRASVMTVAGAVGDASATRNEIPFSIVVVDPGTMTARELFAHDGTELGGGTAAVQVGEALYIGAFRGDRLLRVELAADPGGS